MKIKKNILGFKNRFLTMPNGNFDIFSSERRVNPVEFNPFGIVGKLYFVKNVLGV